MAEKGDVVNISLGDDQAFQRFLVRRVFRDAEFCFTMKSGATHVGYVTAIDDHWVQMSTAENDPQAVLIRADALESIVETGEKLYRFPQETQDQIHQYSRALRSKCEFVLTGGTRPRRDPYYENNGRV